LGQDRTGRPGTRLDTSRRRPLLDDLDLVGTQAVEFVDDHIDLPIRLRDLRFEHRFLVRRLRGGELLVEGRSDARVRQSARGRTIRRCWRTHRTDWKTHHRYGPAGHIKELHAVADFFAGSAVALYQRADVARTKTVIGQVNGQNYVLIHLEIHDFTPDTL